MTAFVAVAILSMTSCRSSYSHMIAASGENPIEEIKSKSTSINDLSMTISTEPITYTIDISTPEGQLKLSNLSLVGAKSLAIREAVMANKCAKLAAPQFTQLMKGKQVLRVTVYGFPAVYKNKE